LQKLQAEMNMTCFLDPLPQEDQTDKLPHNKQEAIINGLLFPINNMTACVYNKSHFNAGTILPPRMTAPDPSTFMPLVSGQVGMV
jgi:hypothetical protein